jgi:hypothetical protein
MTVQEGRGVSCVEVLLEPLLDRSVVDLPCGSKEVRSEMTHAMRRPPVIMSSIPDLLTWASLELSGGAGFGGIGEFARSWEGHAGLGFGLHHEAEAELGSRESRLGVIEQGA